MKKTVRRILTALLTAALAFTACAASRAAAETPRIILYTYYRQMGWGDRVQIGCVDEKGGLWLVAGHDGSLKWPYKEEEQLAYLQTAGKLERVGELGYDDLFDLKGLVASVEDRGQKAVSAANDAGTEYSYALRYGRGGEAERILLGMSGDSMFENYDPNAQALYLRLRQLFPQVLSYAGLIGPAGFQAVPLLRFCGKEGLDVGGAVITAYYNDCEAGPRQLEMTEAEERAVRKRLLNGQVTGKANASVVTGGTVSVSLHDREGNFLASFEFYRGLLVRSDGMYTVEEK